MRRGFKQKVSLAQLCLACRTSIIHTRRAFGGHSRKGLHLLRPEAESWAVYLSGDHVCHIAAQLLLSQAHTVMDAVNLVDHKKQTLGQALHQLGVALLQPSQHIGLLSSFQLCVVQNVDDSIHGIQQSLYAVSATRKECETLQMNTLLEMLSTSENIVTETAAKVAEGLAAVCTVTIVLPEKIATET